MAHFTVHTVDRFGRPGKLNARKLAISTGYYDLPNWMDIPGETLSKVLHYYHDPHPYYGMDVAVIGGKNSAAIAALELWRSGARVTLIYRGPGVTPNVKYWIKPDIENRIKDGEIKAYFSTRGGGDHARRGGGGYSHGPRDAAQRFCLRHDRIPSRFYVSRRGWACDSKGQDRLPVCDPETLESNVPGIYLAGVIVAGSRTSEIFIENGRFHGRQIAASLVSKIKPQEEARDSAADSQFDRLGSVLSLRE